MEKQKNVEAVVQSAYDILENEESVSEEPVDKDWSMSLFDAIAYVSEESMQAFWGRVLAGEIKEPGSCSKRTLNVFKSMSQRDALTFQKISPYILEGDVYCDEDYFILADYVRSLSNDIKYADIMILDDAGLASANSFISCGPGLKSNDFAQICYGEHKMLFKNEKNVDCRVLASSYVLTRAGKELLRLINKNIARNEDYWKICVNEFQKNNTDQVKIEII